MGMSSDGSNGNRPAVPVALGVVGTLALCALGLLPRWVSHAPDVALFIGRFHPALVHLPIGFLVALIVFHLLDRRRGVDLGAATGILLWLSLVASVLAVVPGSLLSLAGGYDAAILGWHRWTATGIAVLLTWAWCFRSLGRRRLYGICLAGALAALIPAGHHGGSLTHGSNYLFAYMPAGMRSVFFADADEPEAPADADLFAGTIQPILDTYCVQCHGPDKQKAKMRLDSYLFLMEAVAEKEILVPGNAEASPLVWGITSPVDDPDHMPPEGKPQPSAQDVQVIVDWINAGAHETAEQG